MKVILFAAGSDGEIHPHLGIGRALMERGHHIVFITTFNYVAAAQQCGFEVLSFLGEDEKQDFLSSTNHLGTIAKVRSYLRFLARKAAEICDLAASHLDEQTLLVGPPFFYVIARLLHARYGTPYASTVLVPAHLYSLKDPPAFKSLRWFSSLPYFLRKPVFQAGERLLIDPFFRTLLKRPCKQMALPLPRRVISRWWYSPQKIVALFYDWFSPAPEDWPDQIAFAGFPLFHPVADSQLSVGLSHFLNAGPPPIVFNPGTETQNPRLFFQATLAAVQKLGARGVFLTRFADQLPDLPETVWHETYTSLPQLLPRASALVHHGGIGTIALALKAGLPQLVLPTWTDQLDNGQRVERLGCGLVQLAPFDTDALTTKLHHLLTSSQVQQACRSIQPQIEPGETVCGRIAEILQQEFDRQSSHRPGAAAPENP